MYKDVLPVMFLHTVYLANCIVCLKDYLFIHSPPKETQHLVQEPPRPQFRVSDPKVKRLLAGVVSPILSHRLNLWLEIEETTLFNNFLPLCGH